MEALDVLMGFHQNQMSRQVIFLQTELSPQQRMLKPKMQLNSLSDNSEDIYLQTKLETYLKRPPQLHSITYPDFYRWWCSAAPQEQKKALQSASKRQPLVIKCKGADDFKGYQLANTKVQAAEQQLASILSECDVHVNNSYDLVALKMCLERHEIAPKAIDAVVRHYVNVGIDLLDGVQYDIPVKSLALAEDIVAAIDLHDTDILKA